jgi:hypothetical protein
MACRKCRCINPAFVTLYIFALCHTRKASGHKKCIGAKNETSFFHPPHVQQRKGFVLECDLDYLNAHCVTQKRIALSPLLANNVLRQKRPFSAKHILFFQQRVT